MYTTIRNLHSYWAYLVVAMIIISVVNGLIGLIAKRHYNNNDLRISLFTLIVTHIQLAIGIILFFVSPLVKWFSSDVKVSEIMQNDTFRMFNLEHPLLMIIAVILITVGFSKHKKRLSSKSKFRTIFIFYLLALLAVLLMIPWDIWWN